MIILGLIGMILVIAHIFLTMTWDLTDPVKTNRLMWLAIVSVILLAISGAWFINVILWTSVAILDGYMTSRNRKRIEAEQEDGEQ